MKYITKVNRRRLLSYFILTLLIIQMLPSTGFSAGEVRLLIDGRRIDALPQPMIKNGRTLVPARLTFEEMGAEVKWNERDRTVHISKGNRSVLLRIDSHLVEYKIDQEKTYGLSDVPPQIYAGRTFVPIRLASNALGVGIGWEESSRTVTVNSNQPADIEPFFPVEIESVQAQGVITGAIQLKSRFPEGVPAGASKIKYLLLNPERGKGKVIARGNQPTATYNYLPEVKDRGKWVLVAALYDDQDDFVAGDAVGVQLLVTPEVSLLGLSPNTTIKDTVSLRADLNFAPAYVKYEITNLDNDRVFLSEEADPYGNYPWTPQVADSGTYSLRVIAYDDTGQAFPSRAVTVRAEVEPRLGLLGVSAGSTITKPVNLLANRNFAVSQTEYILRDPETGREKVLAKIPYGGYTWFPGPDDVGTKEVLVRVLDPAGRVHTSDPVRVKIPAEPQLLLQGVGPNQVVSGPVELTSRCNVDLRNIKYYLLNNQRGERRLIAEGEEADGKYTWTPTPGDEGEWRLWAEGTTRNGRKVTSEEVSFRVYLGQLHEARPIIEKEKFLDFASALAVESWQRTGMSAALQTAQAILETGWGQKVPVDKYSGKFSNNLFGIKGGASAGSVISSTWEEYNGQPYRIDANFRAYADPQEGWADHKDFLLTGSRYEPFRAVMHDSGQGAWALKRCGYATDSQYALKLMDIIRRYNLAKLDEVGI
ncbi:MAG: hypothetical protein GX349_05825 [Firmicutes bacterium]|nr:hypothetical protein [Bacillota bacterium]